MSRTRNLSPEGSQGQESKEGVQGKLPCCSTRSTPQSLKEETASFFLPVTGQDGQQLCSLSRPGPQVSPTL